MLLAPSASSSGDMGLIKTFSAGIATQGMLRRNTPDWYVPKNWDAYKLIDFSISGSQVARFLDQVARIRGLPDLITCDNGTEFTSKGMFFWQKEVDVQLGFIQPGKPIQNAFVDSLNGKFRNECLNQHWFRSIEEARKEIDDWRYHYNHDRPHSALNYQSPVAFAAEAA